jgi:peptidoglycan/xylan/chitin deacetylase (PgdA/CDA1 family)
VLRGLKLSVLRAARAMGVFRLTRDSEWRRRQLLILCYHGISIDDEHEWAPGLYMSQDQFASRLTALTRGGYAVLPFGEAVRRLSDGTLPRRSVTITFDDGNFDFYARAWPVLKGMGMPATVYQTTYYSQRNLPIFPLVLSYLLWKRSGVVASLALPSGGRMTVDSRSAATRNRSRDVLALFAQEECLSAEQCDDLAASLADALGADYQDIRRKRLLHLMNPSEVRELADAGIDFQLHSHRHRSPLERAAYAAEIVDNRRRIAECTGRTAEHFCYPSGVAMPQFAPWLEAEGVVSATTCEPGMARQTSNRFLLPRLLDHSEMTELEFEAWLAGIGALVPRRVVGFRPVDADGRPVISRHSPPRPVPELSKTDAPSEVLRR